MDKECDNCGRVKCVCPHRINLDINVGVGPSIWAVIGFLLIMVVMSDG